MSAKHERELGAFARYCVQRIEKDLGQSQRWHVEIDVRRPGYAARVEVVHLGFALETRGQGQDGPLAVWDAMCRIEQQLRDQHAAVFATLGAKAAND